MFRPRVSWLTVLGALLLALVLAGCSSGGDETADPGSGAAPAAAPTAGSGEQAEDAPSVAVASIEVTSPVFNRIRRIPKEHSCGPGSKTLGRTYDQNYVADAEFPNTSPPLDWTGVPEGTVSIALIMDSNQVPGEALVSLGDVEHPGRRGRSPRGGGDHDRRGGHRPQDAAGC